MDRDRGLPPVKGRSPETSDEAEAGAHAPDAEQARERASNPPHTTTGKFTSPKFGSAGSGGAELEPGPETD